MGTLKLHTEVQFLFLYVGHKASRRVITKHFCVGYADDGRENFVAVD